MAPTERAVSKRWVLVFLVHGLGVRVGSGVPGVGGGVFREAWGVSGVEGFWGLRRCPSEGGQCMLMW